MSNRTILVAVFFVILTLGLTWPLLPNAASAVEDRSDALLNTWILAWDAHQLLSNPLHLFDANIFYPYGNTLAFSEIILPQALLALPFTVASGNPVLGYNIALLASFVLSGLAAYLLVFHLTHSRWGGLAAGVVFAFNSYKMANIAQVQLLVLQWLPLALLYLHRALRSSTDSNTSHLLKTSALLGLFFLLQALSSFYYAIFSAIAIGLYLPVVLAVRRRSVGPRAILHTLLALAVAGLLVMPFVLPYMRVAEQLGFQRSIAENEPFSASLAQWAEALPGNVLYGNLAARSPIIIGGYPLDSLFPGIATLILVLVGLIAWRQRSDVWAFPLLLSAGAFVLSLGPTLFVSPGNPLHLPFPMPYRLLYMLPGMQALRAPVRFAALVFLGLSILVGLGVAAIARSVRHQEDWRRGGGDRALRRILYLCPACLAVIAVIAEVVTIPSVHITRVPTGKNVPEVYRWLAQQQPGVILELPMIGSDPERGLLNQYYSTYHWHTTPDGYSGFIPPKHGEIVYEMQFFPSERSLTMLQGLNVRFLVVHTDRLADWPQREQRLAAFTGDITLTRVFGSTKVFEVKARPMADVHLNLYLPPAVQSGTAYTVTLIATNDGERSVCVPPTHTLDVELTWRSPHSNTVVKRSNHTVALPIVTSSASTVTITSQPPPEGSYDLTVRVRTPSGGETSQTGQVMVQSMPFAQPQVIPARLLLGKADAVRYRPGDTVKVQLRWQALGKIDAYYSVFVRLLDQNGQAIVQVDGQPAGGKRPTLLWVPGEVIEDDWTLLIPSSAPPGRYTLEAGLYRPDDLSPRLTLDAAGQPEARLLLGQVRVAPAIEAVGSPTFAVGATLGDITTLLGYDIEGCTWQGNRCRVQAGETLTITLYWRADKETDADYTVFVHLADATGTPQAQHDGRPRSGDYPTSVWQRGDVVPDQHQVFIPQSVPIGEYRLLTGMYLLTDGRLPVSGGGDRIILTTVEVMQGGSPFGTPISSQC